MIYPEIFDRVCAMDGTNQAPPREHQLQFAFGVFVRHLKAGVVGASSIPPIGEQSSRGLNPGDADECRLLSTLGRPFGVRDRFLTLLERRYASVARVSPL